MSFQMRSIEGGEIDAAAWAAIKAAGGLASEVLQVLRVTTLDLIVWQRAGLFDLARAARHARGVLAYYDREEASFAASRRAGCYPPSGMSPERAAHPRALFSEAIRRLEFAMGAFEEHGERPEIADLARRLLVRMTDLNADLGQTEYFRSTRAFANKRQEAELVAEAISTRLKQDAPPVKIVAEPPKVSARFNINGTTGEARSDTTP